MVTSKHLLTTKMKLPRSHPAYNAIGAITDELDELYANEQITIEQWDLALSWLYKSLGLKEAK